MAPDAAVSELLRRRTVIEAIAELGLATIGVEDVLGALRRFGAVRIEVGDSAFTCVLEIPGEEPERARGATVLQAALACWAETLDSTRAYSDRGIARLERYLMRVDEPQDDAV
jgi:hypothetical protein